MLFLTRLAGHLGKTLAELDSMSLDEVRIWIALDRYEPLGWKRQDYMIAGVMAMLYNKARPRGTPQKTPGEFVMFDAAKPARNLDAQLIEAMMSMKHKRNIAED